MKTEQLNLRLEADLVSALEEAAREESLDRGTMLRKLLRQALVEHRREAGLKRYQRGEISIGRLSEDTGLSHWEIIDLARERGWVYPVDANEFEQPLDAGAKRSRRVAESAKPYSVSKQPERAATSGRGAVAVRATTAPRQSEDATLPDRAPAPGGVLLVGINPAPPSASAGHYYRGTLGRRLWKRLASIGLLNEAVAGHEDDAFVRSGHGLTDVVKRSTRTAAELSRDEVRSGVEALRHKVREWRPRWIVFTFKQAATAVLGTRKVRAGRNQDFEGVPTFLLSSPFARGSETQAADGRLRDLLVGESDTSQAIRNSDLSSGVIRLPASARSHFPESRGDVSVRLRGVAMRVRYDPRIGRSATLFVGVARLKRLVRLGERLKISSEPDGTIRLD